MTSSGPRKRLTVAAALAAGTVAIGMTSPAMADPVASRACRSTIAKSMTKLSATALKFIDGCHKAQDKLSAATAACNAITPGVAPFDPKVKYQAGNDKLAAGIDKKCLVADPVLINYPTSNVDADVFPVIEGQAAGNTIITVGGANQAGNKAKLKCIATIAKARTGVFAEILKESTKCQAAIDKTAVTFGGLDPSCVRTAVKSGPKGDAAIQKACNDAGLAGADVGSCAPLPGCVTSEAQLAAQSSASSIYQLGFATCGNSVIEDPEQCDDGNTDDGDGCSAACETEGKSCTQYPGNTSVVGTRTATIVIGGLTGGQKLAGLTVDFDYPQFQVGIPGTGGSSVVASRVAVLQDTAPTPGNYFSLVNDRELDARIVIASTQEFIDNGNAIEVTLDTCVPEAINLCNRSQNVIGCCNAAEDKDGDTIFQECSNFDAPPVCALGTYSQTDVALSTGLEDCCPGESACVTQALATTCTVSGASKGSGESVDGLTCTVVTAGM